MRGGGSDGADDAGAIRQLVLDLARTSRRATREEVDLLRRFFGDVVLPNVPRPYIHEKYEGHVVENEEWPPGTSVEDYANSLRAAIHDQQASVRLYYDRDYEAWGIIFIAPSRDWEGPVGSGHIAVLFNAERPLWVTGFQPERGLQYVVRQGGFWTWRPR